MKPLVRTSDKADRPSLARRRRVRLLSVSVAVAGILLTTGCAQSASSSDYSDSDYDQDTSSVEAEPAFAQPEAPWPANGQGVAGNGGNGCLSISVPVGSEAYYVKLKQGSSTVWDVFITPGSTTEFAVPLGTYDLTYGAGQEWYGWDHAFGPGGAYSETSETFTFDGDSCWEVELILQVGGNLSTDGLSYGEF